MCLVSTFNPLRGCNSRRRNTTTHRPPSPVIEHEHEALSEGTKSWTGARL